MKKNILSIVLLSFLMPVLLFTATNVAIGDDTTKKDTSIEAVPDVDPIKGVTTITNVVFYILILAATIALIIAGFLFVTAGGDSAKVEKARDFVIYAVIGVVVAILAKGLVNWIKATIK